MHIRIGKREVMKGINRYAVLQYIRQYGPISRTELAKTLQLPHSAVTNIVEELLRENLVRKAGTARSTGGRKPVLLEFHKEHSFLFGVTIEETNIRLALTNLQAEIIHKQSIPFPSGIGPNEAARIVVEHVRDVLQVYGILEETLSGIGVAAVHPVNGKHAAIRSYYADMCSYMSAGLGDIPVLLDTSIKAYTLAELMYGNGRELDSFVCLSVGSHLGMAVVLNGRIRGGDMGAGEFGHTIVRLNGYRCECGQRGCLDMYASEAYLQNGGRALKQHYPHSSIQTFTFAGLEEPLKQFDPLALTLMKRMGTYLGHGIINSIHCLHPKAMILTGEAMKYEQYFLPYALETVQDSFVSEQTDIIVSQLDGDAQLQGAALLVMERIFRAPVHER